MLQSISRREFLKLGSSALALAALPPLPLPPDDLAARRESRFGRVTVDQAGVHSEPDPEAPRSGERRYDDIVNILGEAQGVGHYDVNPLWYQVVGGYIYSPWVQPVAYRFNRPIAQVEPSGLLAWVTVPYTDARTHPDPNLRRRYRLYYDAIFRVVDVQIPDVRSGQVWYGLRDGLTWGDVHWVKAEHLRIIPPQEMTPLSPEVKDKRILIELGKQWLTCFEGQDAVFDTRIASGKSGMVTPLGIHRVLKKAPTEHIAGGADGDRYNLPGTGFVTYFTEREVAIHGVYWHNDYGRRRSHGCVNAPTAAAQWVYRWTRPDVPYATSRVVARENDATLIEVVL